MTRTVDALRIPPYAAAWLDEAAVREGVFTRRRAVSPDPRRFGLFRNASRTSVYPGGATIFQEGDRGHSMFAIKRGSVAIMVDGHTVDTLREEEIFGEMALLEHADRTATVVTLEETELVEIDEPQFLR